MPKKNSCLVPMAYGSLWYYAVRYILWNDVNQEFFVRTSAISLHPFTCPIDGVGKGYVFYPHKADQRDSFYSCQSPGRFFTQFTTVRRCLFPIQMTKRDNQDDSQRPPDRGIGFHLLESLYRVSQQWDISSFVYILLLC